IRGVLHSFTGSAAMAEAGVAMGLYLSFAGMLTYKNAADLRRVAATVPLNRLLVETDSPYLSPVPLRGKRNEPANVVHTTACLAGSRAGAERGGGPASAQGRAGGGGGGGRESERRQRKKGRGGGGGKRPPMDEGRAGLRRSPRRCFLDFKPDPISCSPTP